MENQNTSSKSISYIMNTKNWWGPLTFILIISILGVGMIGYQTYIDAPPMSGFTDDKGNVVIDKKTLEHGQEVFHKYALMEYGSFLVMEHSEVRILRQRHSTKCRFLWQTFMLKNLLLKREVLLMNLW
jgi:hypothetical protein